MYSSSLSRHGGSSYSPYGGRSFSSTSHSPSWTDRYIKGNALGSAKKHVESGAQAVRQGGEALLVGALLAAIDVYGPKGGLDIPLDKSHKYAMPIDGAIGVAGLIAGVVLAGEEFAPDMRNAGATAMGIFAYRKSQNYLAIMARKSGKLPAYQFSDSYAKADGATVLDFGASKEAIAKSQYQTAQALGAGAGVHGDYSYSSPSGFGSEDPIVVASRGL